MPAMINRLNIARVLTMLGFLIGLRSVGFTWAHIGDEMFVLTADSRLAVTHSWHHYFREVFGDVSAMAVILLILYVRSDGPDLPMRAGRSVRTRGSAPVACAP